MNKLFLKLSLILALMSQVACSQRWYEVDPGASNEQIISFITQASSSTSQFSFTNSSDATLINQLFENGADVFYKKSGNGFPATSVLQIWDMGVFRSDLYGIPANQINLSEATVAVLDGFANDGQRYVALIIEMVIDGQSSRFTDVVGAADHVFSENDFVAYMQGADGTPIAIMTTDLSDEYTNTLGIHVQFSVHLFDGQNELQIGQFAPLAGM